MTMLGLEVTRAENVFRNVSALYATLIEGRNQMRVRRVELNMNNEVSAEPLDFLCDVESKAKRTLSPRQYTLFQCFAKASATQLTSLEVQLALGEIWYKTGLDLDGTYASLYFRIKNAQARESMKARIENGTRATEPNQFD